MAVFSCTLQNTNIHLYNRRADALPSSPSVENGTNYYWRHRTSPSNVSGSARLTSDHQSQCQHNTTEHKHFKKILTNGHHTWTSIQRHTGADSTLASAHQTGEPHKFASQAQKPLFWLPTTLAPLMPHTFPHNTWKNLSN